MKKSIVPKDKNVRCTLYARDQNKDQTKVDPANGGPPLRKSPTRCVKIRHFTNSQKRIYNHLLILEQRPGSFETLETGCVMVKKVLGDLRSMGDDGVKLTTYSSRTLKQVSS